MNTEAQEFLKLGGQVIVRMRGLPYDCTAKQVVSSPVMLVSFRPMLYFSHPMPFFFLFSFASYCYLCAVLTWFMQIQQYIYDGQIYDR